MNNDLKTEIKQLQIFITNNVFKDAILNLPKLTDKIIIRKIISKAVLTKISLYFKTLNSDTFNYDCFVTEIAKIIGVMKYKIKKHKPPSYELLKELITSSDLYMLK